MTRIRYFAGAAESAGREEHSLDGPMTLGELRQRLTAEHGAAFTRVLGRCSLLVDGARLDDKGTVPDAATVDVLPPFAGG